MVINLDHKCNIIGSRMHIGSRMLVGSLMFLLAACGDAHFTEIREASNHDPSAAHQGDGDLNPVVIGDDQNIPQPPDGQIIPVDDNPYNAPGDQVGADDDPFGDELQDDLPSNISDTADTATPTNHDDNYDGDDHHDDGTNRDPYVINEDGDVVVNRTIARIEIKSMVDHDSKLIVTDSEIYWLHQQYMVPYNTDVTFYDENGNVINDIPWNPVFKSGQGPDCHLKQWSGSNYLGCESCQCYSDKIKLGVQHSLKGTMIKLTGRGRTQTYVNSDHIETYIQDYPHMGGESFYHWIIE